MLIRIEARNSRGQVLLLPLEDISSGYIVAGVDGLDPVKATLVSTSFANMDGEQYHSSRREARNLVVHLELDTGSSSGSVDKLRRGLYAFFMPKSSVMLRFVHDDGLSVDIRGRVETCEAPPFTDEPKVDISMMCFDPDFVDPTPVVLSRNTANETVLPQGRLEHDYKGTVETGLLIKLMVNRPMKEFTIYHSMPGADAATSLIFDAELLPGDLLTISTVPGDKHATVTRNGVNISYLYGVSPFSNWHEFEPGMNYFRFYAEGEPVPFTIEYTTKYGGL